MNFNILVGILLIAAGAFSSGSFAVPFGKIKGWFVVWQVWVSLMLIGMLFKGVRSVYVWRWHVYVTLVASGVLFGSVCRVGVVG